jgi:hypothetical protein
VRSSIIGKIEKAKRYILEPERIMFHDFKLSFDGDHNAYDISYTDGKWHCSCDFFSSWKICSHTIALQKLLGEMLPQEALGVVPQYSLQPPAFSQFELNIEPSI